MARPVKNYCDYFTHDNQMRNHRKVKAIRSKFGISGYAIWNMLLEYMTGTDGNEFEYSDMEFELMSGDFGVSATEIRSVVDYCIFLELLFNNNGFIHSNSLDERLAPVYQKRGVAKEVSKKQSRCKGKFTSSNTESNGVSVVEMPQIKLNNIKVNYTIHQDDDLFKNKSEAFEYLKGNYLVIEETKKTISGKGWPAIDEVHVVGLIKMFVNAKADLSSPPNEIRRHFKNWVFREPIKNITEIAENFKKTLP